jgi:hypothetical protein
MRNLDKELKEPTIEEKSKDMMEAFLKKKHADEAKQAAELARVKAEKEVPPAPEIKPKKKSLQTLPKRNASKTVIASKEEKA